MSLQRSIVNLIRKMKASMGMKISLALLSIAVVLLLSSVITVMEYTRMSDYVSELIADNINSINVAQKLASVTDTYNLEILTVVGDETSNRLPDFNQAEFVSHCDSLRTQLRSNNKAHLADSVMYSYSAYMLTSLELPQVIASNFIDSKDWYFDRLQPVFNRLRRDIDQLNTEIYNELKKNSATFDRGFYRSVIPGAVAVGVGLLLVLLLLFFLMTYFVVPIGKMRRSLQDYQSYGGNYTYDFEGDDQLHDLNVRISDLVRDNRNLRRQVKNLTYQRDRDPSAGPDQKK